MPKKPYKDRYLVNLKVSWSRARSQAAFRSEPWEITWEQWRNFFTPELFDRRGRGIDDLCVCRYDDTDSWRIGNVAMIDRRSHLLNKIAVKQGRDRSEYWQNAIWMDRV